MKGDFMRFHPKTRLFVISVLTLLLSHIPNVAVAEVALQSGQMVPTSILVADLTRAQAQSRIQNYLDQKELRQNLADRGLSADEISTRLASLSDTEMKQLAQQMDQAQYGGDILVAILLVVLIIYFAKRI